jgi:hypothetical protein
MVSKMAGLIMKPDSPSKERSEADGLRKSKKPIRQLAENFYAVT